MKKLISICSAALLSSLAMANYVMYVNDGSEVKEEFPCSSVDSLKLTGTNLSVFSYPKTIPFAINDNLSLTFEEPMLSDTVKIAYSDGAGVTVSNPFPDSISISSVGEHVTVNSISEKKDVVYLLSGSSDNGSFVIESPKRFTVVLDNLNLKSQTENSPIRSYSSKTMTIVLPDGSVSKLTDSAKDTCNAVIRSKGQIVFSESGKGSVTVTAAAKRAIQTGDYLVINGGDINVESNLGDAIKVNDYFEMNEGRLYVTGGVEVSAGYAVVNGGFLYFESDKQDDKLLKIVQNPDPSAEDADLSGTLTINGGSLTFSVMGKGSKGIKASRDIIIKGGYVEAKVDGSYFLDADGEYNVSSLAKADRNLLISGGSVIVTVFEDALGGRGLAADSALSITGKAKVSICNLAENYLTTKGKVKVGYGLKCDRKVTIGGDSEVKITANAAKNSAISIYSGQDLVEVNDNAKLYIQSSSNQTLEGKNNLTLDVNGGVTVSFAGNAYSPASLLQSNGGVFIGLGSKPATPNKSTYCVIQDASYVMGNAVNVKDASGSDMLTFQGPETFLNSSATSAYLVVTAPALTEGSSCTYTIGGTVGAGNSFNGYYENANYTGGTPYQVVCNSVAKATLVEK